MAKRFSSLYVSIILASSASLSMLAANTAQAELVPQGKKSKYPAEKIIVSTNEVDVFFQCSQIADNVGRLACYDKVAEKGANTLAEKKQPLDLVKTVETSIQEGKATPVLAGSNVNLAKPEDNSQMTKSADPKQDQAILAQVGVAKEDLQHYTPLSLLYDLDKNDPKGILSVRPHQPMYVLPVFYNAQPNRHVKSPNRESVDYSDSQLMNLDSKMQISMKTKLFQDVFGTNADVWAGYTQQSYWQVYNRHSRPFRSSDYQPEIFVTQPVKAGLPGGGDLRMLGAGVVHQSNGQSDPLSRSWNRAYIMSGAEWGKLTVVPRLWFIFPENDKTSDNPDIADYMGYGDVRFLYNLGDRNTLGGMIRYNPVENKGALQIDYARPISGGMKGYIQLFHGYGENIQDYNHLNTTIGLGVMFNDFLGL